MLWLFRVVSVGAALAALVSIALISVTPAVAQSVSMYHGNASCGSPAYTYGDGASSSSGSTVTAVTTRTGGGASCTYRAVQLNWWNGSTYVATGWDEQFSQNAAVGVSASFGWAQHRLGYNASAYDYRETSSWL